MTFDDNGIYEADLPVSRLLLDEDNFRIDQVDKQREALFALLRQQRQGDKIFNLAKHIVDRGRLAPGERLLVIPNDQQNSEDEAKEDLYVVMEGNRRLTALKLLEHPQLIQETFPALYRKFVSLVEGAPVELLSNVPCVILPDRETALEWVEIKHSTNLDGVGLEKWDAEATARFAERRGTYRRWRIALNRVEEAGLDIEELRQGIDGKTTAVERVLGARVIREALGLLFHNNQGTVEFENGDEKAGVALLQMLLKEMGKDTFSTATVHALPDRESFVRTFVDFSVKGSRSDNTRGGSKPANKPSSKNSNAAVKDSSTARRDEVPPQNESKTVSRSKNPLRRQTDRRTLAPKSREETYHIHDDAVNGLYKELRKILVGERTRTAGVMTRVFLELSCDAYLETRKLPLPNHFSKRGIKRWSDARLREKVQAVLEDVDPSSSNEELKPTRRGISGTDLDWLHSIDSLHELVHNRLANITAQEVKIIWDRYHPFFKALYDKLEDS